MKHKHIIMMLLLTVSSIIHSQFLHTAEEMEGLLNSSPHEYLLQETINLSPEAFQTCRASNDPHLQTSNTTTRNPLWKEINKGDRKKLKKKNKRILRQIEKSNEDHIIHQLSSNHFRLGNFDEAIYYKLLLTSPKQLSFDDEYFLAKAYYETKQYDFALEHVFNAKITLPYLAKGDKQYEKELTENLLKEILHAKKVDYEEWALQLSYCITNKDNKTYVSFKSEPWKAYAVCKSIWQEDEVHQQKMTLISDQALWLVEEKECLLNAMTSYMRHEKDNPEFVGLKHLENALNDNYVKEFIHYEVFVSQYLSNPDGVPSNMEIKKLRAYFLKAHSVTRK